MKIAYPVIQGKSGGDIYFERLNKSIKKFDGYLSRVIYYPHYTQFAPHIIKFFNNYKLLNKYDIIHSSAEWASLFYEIPKPLVVTVFHIVFDNIYRKYLSLPQRIYHGSLLRYIEKSLHYGDKIISISNFTKYAVESTFGISDIEVIYPGIDINLFKPIYINNDPFPDKTKILFVGNLTKRKGADLLPKILHHLGDNFVLLYTLGLRTSQKFKYRNMIPLGKLTLSELVKYYNLADIVIIPSRLEGFGYVAAEAMACGKPIVATNYSSLPELIDDGKGGFLCELDNAKEFAEKIKILAEDENLRRKMGKYNRKKAAKKFDIITMAKEYIKIYKRL